MSEARHNHSGFTLVELLVVICIIAVLVAISFPALSLAREHALCASCSSRMRALGMAFMMYAGDNDQTLPGRVEGAGNDKWPLLLRPYVADPKNYVDPGDVVANQVSSTVLLSNGANGSSFFFNGFNDLGFYANSGATIRLNNLKNLSNLILLGQKVNGSTQFYMDFIEGNQNDILNKTAYFGGSNYVYADGSSRFVTKANYNDRDWLVDQSYTIPVVPGH